MFDLEKSIAGWRNQMLAAGVETPVPLEELEAHLREEFARQVRSGLPESQAFDSAVAQIGSPQSLKSEYQKLDDDQFARKEKWMRAYAIAFPVCYAIYTIWCLTKLEVNRLEWASGLCAIVLTCLGIAAVPYCHRFLPVIAGKNRRLTLQVSGLVAWIVLGLVYAEIILPRQNLSMGQLLVNWLWLMMPSGVLSAVGYGLGLAAKRQNQANAS